MTHHYVCLAWRLPKAHIAADYSNKLSPAFRSNQIPQSYDCIWVLVQGKYANYNAAAAGSLKKTENEILA